MANSGDTSYFHEFKEFCGSGKSGETGESCECECGDSRVDGDSDDSSEYGDFVEHGETGDSAYSDNFC